MSNLAHKTLLLVEDEMILAMVAKMKLEEYGYTVHHVNSGEKAVQIIIEKKLCPIDIILMDIDLGNGIDGTQAAEQILTHTDIPVVFLSSHTEPQIVEKTEKITSYGYVVKNSNITVIDASIKMAFKLFDEKNEHKIKEVALQESEKRFYELFERAPLGYQSLDINGNFIAVNEAWLETLGYSKEELIGKWFGDFLSPEYVEAFRNRFPIFKAEGRIHSEFYMLHKNGSKKYIAFDGRIGHNSDGSFKQTHCILKDETERKQAEEISSHLAEIADIAPGAIIVSDYTGMFLFTNEKASLLLGYSKTELFKLDLQRINTPESAKNVTTNMEHIEKNGEAEFEVIHIRKDGSTFPAQVFAKKITWQGKPAILSVFTDSSDFYKREEQKASILLQQQLLNSFMIEQSQLTDIDQLLTNILDQLDRILHPIVVVYSEYDKASETLKIKKIETQQKILDTIVKVSGKQILSGVRSVSAEMYHEMKINQVKVFSDPKELASPIISQELIITLGNLFKIKSYIGLNYILDEDVFGTTLLMLEQESDPYMLALLRNFAHFSSISLKRIATQQALNISQANYKQKNEILTVLFDNLTSGVFMVEAPSGKPILANKAAQHILGRGILPDCSEKNLAEVYNAYKNQSRLPYPVEEMPITRAMKGESLHVDDMLVKHPDGVEILLDVYGAPIYNEQGEIWASLVNFYDITRQKQAENALKERTNLLSRIMETSPVGIVTLDKTGNINYANDRAEQILGLKKEEITSIPYNAPIWKHTELDGSSLKDEKLPFNIVKNTMKTVYDIQHGITWPDGTVVLLSVNGSPLLDSDGNFDGMVATFDDISVNKKNENEILKQLSEKEILLREIHHRVKNNIASIEGLLNLQASTSTSLEAKAALQDAVARVQSMRILYDKLLLTNAYQDISIKSYTENLIDSLLAVFAIKPHITIEMHITDFNICSKTAVTVGIIINELLTNVFKYAFVHQDDGLVSISIERTENKVTLIIKDNGVGIDENIESHKTHGFGLTIVTMLANQLKGKYRIFNDKGTISILEFEL